MISKIKTKVKLIKDYRNRNVPIEQKTIALLYYHLFQYTLDTLNRVEEKNIVAKVTKDQLKDFI